jgi:hypothetical protein
LIPQGDRGARGGKPADFICNILKYLLFMNVNLKAKTLIQMDFIRNAFSRGGDEAHHGTSFTKEMNHEDGLVLFP